jgi:hypothetical protein
VRVTACKVLQALGSVACRRELLDGLEDPDPEIVASVLSCLASVTGAKAPADRAIWAKLLGENR